MKKMIFFLLLPAAICAQDNTAAYDRYMLGQETLYGFSGNVLIAKKGQVLYQRSFGFSNYDSKEKNNSNSVFDVGSIAKEFTAVGILLLKDKGLISYTDTIRKFFPELPYHNVTIQQLLTHTSGMADGFELLARHFDHHAIAGNNDLVNLLAREKPALLFKPGESMMYSGTAFNLLASVIEKISGQSYKTYMEQNVFAPLEMTHTSVANRPRTEKDTPGYSNGYVYNDSLQKYVWAGSLETGWVTYLAGITGEGMIITTAEDLLKWDRSLKLHSLLKQTTQQEMLSAQATHNFLKITFGYGMRVGKNDLGNYIFHNGYYPGFISQHICYTDEDLTIIVLSNNESRSDFIADALASVALNKKVEFPLLHKVIAVTIPAGKYDGKYMMRLIRPPYMALFPVEFISRNNKLYIHPGNGADIELRPWSDNKFFFANGTDQQVEFETDDNGIPVKVWHIAWGIKKELKKIE